ncbi:MAG: radical SAM family heme chaperone HemW [Candidatus Celaenobacter antarcticus]|nr:radical SAM family heme chaperone HemW [Candidatus Celaenobacter antarcticus]
MEQNTQDPEITVSYQKLARKVKEISLYIHIPFCTRKCNYCNFYSITYDAKLAENYIRSLTKEISQYKNKNYALTSIYIGGGTPSLLSFPLLFSLFSGINDTFSISPNIEVTIEANPASITKDASRYWNILGINRVSMGVQSFNDNELKILGRIHSEKDIQPAFEIVRDHCTENISLDLMYGIPVQTHGTLMKSLQRAIELEPKHISSYCLSLEKGTPLFDARAHYTFPSEDIQKEMYYSMLSFLEDNCFHQYEISNFSNKGYESQHNISYWKGKEYIGCGAAAHSFYDMTRKENISDVQRYINNMQNEQSVCKSSKLISKREYISDMIFLGLRMTKGVPLSYLKKELGFDVIIEYSDIIDKYSKLGYLTVENDHLKLTKKALFVSDEILSEFV